MHIEDSQTNSESTDKDPSKQSKENFGKLANEKDQLFPKRLTKEYIGTLPIISFEGKIHIIKESKDVVKAVKILRRERVIGFDTETRPNFKKGKQNKVSLLQLSTQSDAFLFRLNYLGLPKELLSLLTDSNIFKVGVAILDDIRALQKLRKFNTEGFVELSNIGNQLGIVTCGLQNLAAIFFGVRITKKEQLTNWERSELNQKQCLYAATDAWICLEMYSFLEDKKLLPEKIIWKMPHPKISRTKISKKLD